MPPGPQLKILEGTLGKAEVADTAAEPDSNLRKNPSLFNMEWMTWEWQWAPLDSPPTKQVSPRALGVAAFWVNTDLVPPALSVVNLSQSGEPGVDRALGTRGRLSVQCGQREEWECVCAVQVPRSTGAGRRGDTADICPSPRL